MNQFILNYEMTMSRRVKMINTELSTDIAKFYLLVLLENINIL